MMRQQTCQARRRPAFRVPDPVPTIVIGLLLVMVLAACGKKGPVRPKLQSLPAAPQDVTLQQRGEIFLLGWTLPEHNQDGSPAEDLTRFRILRSVYDAADPCPTCREPVETVAMIDLSYPAPAQRIGKRFYWFDETIRPGNGYRYRIVPVTIGRQTGEPTDIHRIPLPSPPAPTGLTATAGDRQSELAWQAPPLPAGMELLGYNLYRRQVGQPFAPVPVNPGPLTVTSMVDLGLANDQDYEYRVTLLAKSGSETLESVPTAGVLVRPREP